MPSSKRITIVAFTVLLGSIGGCLGDLGADGPQTTTQSPTETATDTALATKRPMSADAPRPMAIPNTTTTIIDGRTTSYSLTGATSYLLVRESPRPKADLRMVHAIDGLGLHSWTVSLCNHPYDDEPRSPAACHDGGHHHFQRPSRPIAWLCDAWGLLERHGTPQNGTETVVSNGLWDLETASTDERFTVESTRHDPRTDSATNVSHRCERPSFSNSAVAHASTTWWSSGREQGTFERSVRFSEEARVVDPTTLNRSLPTPIAPRPATLGEGLTDIEEPTDLTLDATLTYLTREDEDLTTFREANPTAFVAGTQLSWGNDVRALPCSPAEVQTMDHHRAIVLVGPETKTTYTATVTKTTRGPPGDPVETSYTWRPGSVLDDNLQERGAADWPNQAPAVQFDLPWAMERLRANGFDDPIVISGYVPAGMTHAGFQGYDLILHTMPAGHCPTSPTSAETSISYGNFIRINSATGLLHEGFGPWGLLSTFDGALAEIDWQDVF